MINVCQFYIIYKEYLFMIEFCLSKYKENVGIKKLKLEFINYNLINYFLIYYMFLLFYLFNINIIK